MTTPTYLPAASLPFLHSKRSLLLAISLLLPLTVSAAPSDALLPDMNATTSLKAPIQLRNLDMSAAVKRAIEWHPMVTGAREREISRVKKLVLLNQRIFRKFVVV